jgi:argininosuccinate lyase
MPQKKNPDMAELIRGKTGRVYGSLIGLLTMLKGLPLAYNKDMQEDKEAVFDAVDTVKSCLSVFTGMLTDTVFNFNKERMARSVLCGYSNATDAADWLVKKGIPFRDAHELISKLVRYAINKGVSLNNLSIEEYNRVSGVFDETIYDAISIDACINARNTPGGPSASAVTASIENAKAFIESATSSV